MTRRRVRAIAGSLAKMGKKNRRRQKDASRADPPENEPYPTRPENVSFLFGLGAITESNKYFAMLPDEMVVEALGHFHAEPSIDAVVEIAKTKFKFPHDPQFDYPKFADGLLKRGRALDLFGEYMRVLRSRFPDDVVTQILTCFKTEPSLEVLVNILLADDAFLLRTGVPIQDGDKEQNAATMASYLYQRGRRTLELLRENPDVVLAAVRGSRAA